MTFIKCFMEIDSSSYCSIEQHSDPGRCTHLVLTQLTQLCERLHIIECSKQQVFLHPPRLQSKLLIILFSYNFSVHKYQFSNVTIEIKDVLLQVSQEDVCYVYVCNTYFGKHCMSTHIHCHELILSQTLEDVCSTQQEKCSVMTHTCIGTVMDGSKIHTTHNVQSVMSLFHTSAISDFYKHKQA